MCYLYPTSEWYISQGLTKPYEIFPYYSGLKRVHFILKYHLTELKC